MTTELTVGESKQLADFERVIESGFKTFVEVGNALLAIRNGKLYRSEHGTFEAYCRERWGFTIRHADRLMVAASTIAAIAETRPMGPLPESERQARPLSKLPPAEQPAAWQEATDKAAAEGRKVKASDVEEVVEKITTERKETSPIMSKKQAATMKPCVGLKYARLAIGNLEQIKDNDEERNEAFALVKGWITDHE